MKSRDLTKGNVTQNILYMAVPVMLSMITHTIYDLVDMLWIGRISAVAVAGVTVFSSLYFLVFALNNVIGGGSVAVLSQSFGSGNKAEARKAIANTFAFKLMAGIIAGLILFIALEPLLNLFTDDPQVLSDALAYGKIRALFLPVMFSSFTVTTALRCSGDSKSPMYITMITAILNIILDPIFIFDTVPYLGIPGLGLGVFGAALATVISVTVSFIVAYWLMFGPSSTYKLKLTDLWTIDWGIVKRILTIGLPQATSNMLRNLANVIILGFITAYGTFAIAAWGIVGRILNLLLMPIFGLMQGGSTVVGQNVGANRVDRAIEASSVASKLGFISMLLISIITFFAAPQIVAVFSDNKEVYQVGGQALRVIVFGMPVIAVYMGRATIFTGTGYTIPFLISGAIGQWAIQIPCVILFTRVLELPFIYLAVTYLLYNLGEGLVLYYFYYKGGWRKKAEQTALAANRIVKSEV